MENFKVIDLSLFLILIIFKLYLYDYFETYYTFLYDNTSIRYLLTSPLCIYLIDLIALLISLSIFDGILLNY